MTKYKIIVDRGTDDFTNEMKYLGHTEMWEPISRIDRGRIWSGGDPIIFDTKEEAEKVLRMYQEIHGLAGSPRIKTV